MAVGSRVSGILGVPFFSNVVFGFQDVDESFYIGSSHVRRFDAAFPVEVKSGYLWTENIDTGMPLGRFQLDTGMISPLSLCSEDFDKAAEKGHLYGAGKSYSYTITGTYPSRSGFLRTISLWGYKFDDVPVKESNQAKIGLSLLRKLDFRINVADRTIEVAKNAKTDQPFRYDRTGISLLSLDGKISVASVVEDSPGHKAGIRELDTLLAINGVAVDSSWIGLSNARASFTDPDLSEATLTIQRENVDKVVVVHLLPKVVAP